MSLECGAKARLILGLCVAIALMLGLRCVALDSDAYPGLTWSSAVVTDEGFYIHNARNRILFGNPHTDQFNNDLIMPLLDACQTGVFRTVGVGAVQARAISVVLGLLTLPVFFDSLRRAFGLRPALFGLLLLGLDHVTLLYSRMALMDTPAAFVLVCAFWLWVRSGEAESGARNRRWLALCGLVLGLCYAVRGLGALVYPVPLLILGWEGWKAKRQVRGTKTLEVGAPKREDGTRVPYFLGGLALALGVYGVVWYLPNRAELTRVNHYYLFTQLVPHNLANLWFDVNQALFGDERGGCSYLFRHAPVQFVLTLLGVAAWPLRRGRIGLRAPQRRNALYLGLWLSIVLAVFGVVRYSPSRYYLIFYPAMTGIAALALSQLGAVLRTVWSHRMARVGIGGFLTYHLCLVCLHHKSDVTDFGLYSVPVLVCLGLFLLPAGRSRTWSVGAWHRQAAILCVVWALINAVWLGDWLTHLHYRQRDADRWLAENLPPQSILIGDAAPGLCMNNRFVAVNVISGLCNYQQPLETFASQGPRYVVILGGKQSIDWWHNLYPEVIQPQRLKHTFSGLINFAVNVYEVPTDAAQLTTPSRKP